MIEPRRFPAGTTYTRPLWPGWTTSPPPSTRFSDTMSRCPSRPIRTGAWPAGPPLKTQSNIITGAPLTTTAPSGLVQPETWQSCTIIGATGLPYRRNAREPTDVHRRADEACSGAARMSTSLLASKWVFRT